MSVRSKRIKSLIEQSKLSYQELEKRTGIKKSSLQRYASGVTAKIPLDVIEKLSATFGVSQEYLLGWSDEEKTTVAEADNSIGKSQKQLIDFARNCTEEQAEQYLKMFEAMKGFLGEK